MLTRRQLIAQGAALASASRLVDALAAIPPAGSRLTDIEHVVFLIQENRSFDHYFGTYRGVRGFADPAARRTNAQPGYDGGVLYPFHLDAQQGSGQCVSDPNHDWGPQHRSWNGGRMDGFVREHQGDELVTMGYYARGDLPYYHALADAFTLCDGYHCPVIGPSYPNQVYAVSGTLDPAGAHGGPVVGDVRAGSLSWTTMPEQLEARGISWKVYTSPDNYAPEAVGDPPFHFFAQYFSNDALRAKAFANAYPAQLQQDCRDGALPQVSWVYAPVTMSEHPPAPVNSGEGTTATVLDALLANPALWARTALFITWDENGGFYDHVAPFTAPPDVRGEWITVPNLPDACQGIRGPIGLGFRVPMLVVSPFSRGGLVCPDRFDHTSMLRFLERRFGAEVPNLGAWRRAVAGDLTAAFDFASPANPAPPRLPDATPLAGASPGCALSVVGSQVVAVPGSSYPVPPNSEPQQEAGSARRPSGIPPPPRRRAKRRRKRRKRKRMK